MIHHFSFCSESFTHGKLAFLLFFPQLICNMLIDLYLKNVLATYKGWSHIFLHANLPSYNIQNKNVKKNLLYMTNMQKYKWPESILIKLYNDISNGYLLPNSKICHQVPKFFTKFQNIHNPSLTHLCLNKASTYISKMVIASKEVQTAPVTYINPKLDRSLVTTPSLFPKARCTNHIYTLKLTCTRFEKANGCYGPAINWIQEKKMLTKTGVISLYQFKKRSRLLAMPYVKCVIVIAAA